MSPESHNQKSLLTPGNVLTGLILVLGLYITILRFTKGIGGVTALDDNNPWGIWISFDLLCGVVLAAGGYATTSAYYLFGLKDFNSAVRPAVTSAFLGYFFVVVALHYDVGQPWRLVFAAALSGTRDQAPSEADAEPVLRRMVEAVKTGAFGAYLPFDREGRPVRLG